MRAIARAWLNFAFSGLLPAAPTNVAKPAAPVYDAVEPEPFLNAEALLGGILGYPYPCKTDTR